MEFCTSHAKIAKTSSGDVTNKELSNIFTNRFIKDLSINEDNEIIKELPSKISIDRNNNKHVLSPLGLYQGPKGIKVSRLSLQISESSIRHSLVQQFGVPSKNNQSRNYNIKSIVLESAAGPSPTRWAIVTFVTSQDAERAIQSASKLQSVELHPGYELYEYEAFNIGTNNFQGLDEFHPQASRTLQISNLPPHLNNFKTIHDYFTKFGKVLDIEIKPKLVPHASALVQFSDISKVVKILSNPRAVLKNLVGSSITSSTSFQFGPSFPTNCIWLGHLSNSIAENHVTEYFSRFGHVLEVVQDVKQQKALVYLDNAFASQQSILHLKRKNSFLGNCRVQVDYASLECQATISYWLLNNFPILPVPPENSSPKHLQSDSIYNCHSIVPSVSRTLVHQNSFNDKNNTSLIKAASTENFVPNSQVGGIFSHKTSDESIPYSQIHHVESLSHLNSSTKTSQASILNSGFNILDMMITERVQTDNATRVTPMKRSNNIRLSNSYDPNCDSSGRLSDHINEQSMNNISINLNQSTEYINTNTISTKKDRGSLESNVDGRNQNNIRLCNSQSNDLNKPDTINRQFSPWSAPVRNRVVARVVPYPHTSSNAPNVSHLNSNLTSKFNPNTHSIRSSSSTVPQNVNRNIHKSYTSYPEKEIPTNKQDNLLSINHNYLHLINDRDTDPQKRRPNYNQPVTYRVKNTDGTPKSFDLRNSSFPGVHNEKSRGYRFSELPEVADKPVTAAQVFGEDFSDLSDNDSSPSYASRTAVMMTESRKRKSKGTKCVSPSSDSSSTMSVLSSEKQNRFVRVSKPHFHSKKTSVHVTSINRNKKLVKLKTCSSSDDQRKTVHNSKISRHQMKFSIKEKPEKKNISMKPLTVNVSLTNFEDDVLESDETSSTENSSENSSKVSIVHKECLSLKNKQPPQQINKRKLIIENPQKYRSNEHHLSSSSDNEYSGRRFQVSNTKAKSYMLNEHEIRKATKYIHDRQFKDKKYVTKTTENAHGMKLENDHYSQRQMNYTNSSHNFIVGRQFREKDAAQQYRDQNVYMPRNRQRSDSPPVKRQKLKNEDVEKNNRGSEKNKSAQIISRHNFGKHDHQKIHQELSSDAAFQKEFDEFKRDQAGDISQSNVQRKCNSSIMSSVSSTGTKSFSSFKKFKSKKQESSSKYTMYDTIDSKNIFQIDMNNINIYESMYDKVKRRAQKQAESKINQHSSDVMEQRNKRKSKTMFKESKHISKDDKSYHKRHKKSRERMSRSSSLYSRASSPLVDDVMSSYSSKVYPSLSKSGSHRKLMVHKDNYYKSSKAKSNVVSSFDSTTSYSRQNWNKKESHDNQETQFIVHKFNQKYKSDNTSHKSKHLENEFSNDIDDHENISEFSYVTNVSNVINMPTKSTLEYQKKDTEEIGNGSDATASTEPMEYVEVDLESLKLSDDDWKSGLSSQSSSESGAAMSKESIQKMEIANDSQESRSIIADKAYSIEHGQLSDPSLENDIRFEINTKTDEIKVDVEFETNNAVEKESKEIKACSMVIEAEESTKEEQDIAIASIMLKEENECKSPIDWESNRVDLVSLPLNSVNSIFISETNSKEIKAEEFDCSVNNDNKVEEVDIGDLCKTEIKMIIPVSASEIIENVELHEAVVDDCSKEVKEAAQDIAIQSSLISLKSDPAPDVDIIPSTNEKTKEHGLMNLSQCDVVAERHTSSSDSSLQENNSVSNSKLPSNNKGSNNTSPTVKEDLTSYVKSVIERVMQEQSVENQNKLKFEKCMNKRNKKANAPVATPIKPVSVITTSTGSNTPVSVSTSLQKSPSVSYQAVVIENIEQYSTAKTVVTSGAPVIPGVNVCSPVTTTCINTIKPVVDLVISAASTDSSLSKQSSSRPNVISIINLPCSTHSLKIDPTTTVISASSELKVNTDLTSFPSSVSDTSTSVTSSNSTIKPNSQLKSPGVDDQTKQRICTRLRRADPNKSDGNYKVVMTIPTNNLEPANLGNKSSNVDCDHQDQNFVKSSIKLVDSNLSVTDSKPTNEKQISDPYEPNFDESPLELSHYRTKTKNTFFPIEEKSSQPTCVEESSTNLAVSSTIPTTVDHTPPIAVSNHVSSTIDSLSQVIEDVAHGNFNYNEYLTSFKNGKLTSLHISPSTTPLTFVSNDSRDCSSVSADNQNNISLDSGPPISHRKTNASKHSNNNTHNSDDVKKVDHSMMSNHAHSTTSQRYSTTNSSGPMTCLDMSISHTTNDKLIPINVDVNSLFTTKSTVSNVSISPVYSNNCTTQFNNETFTLINPAVLCRAVDNNSQKIKQASNSGVDPSPSSTLSSVQIQPFSILSTNAALSFDKDIALNSLEQNISKSNLINISVNSVQSNINSILSPVVQNSDDKTALKQFYINVLQQRNTMGGMDSSAFSHLQNILSEAHFKSLNPTTDSSLFRISQSINDPSTSSLSQTMSIQEPSISSMMGLPQNISSKFIADLVIPREYPLVWEGKLSLKNEEAKVALHFVHGNSELLNACMHLLIYSGSLQWNNTGPLKIVQRMRLDTSQLEGVQRRMQNTNEYCIGLALPGGDDTNQWMRQSQILKDGFIKYMREKGAAGIINVCHPENNQQGLYVVHIFPPCEFSTNQLCATAPQLANIIDSNKVPSLLVVITTV